jgi:hypothetical protein
LTEGDVIKKWPGRKGLQKGSFTIRRIWADAKLQKICWGEIGQANKVKGFLELGQTVSIEEDEDDKEGLKFTIVAEERSLDLEAKSSFTRDRWVRALRYLINDKKQKK